MRRFSITAILGAAFLFGLSTWAHAQSKKKGKGRVIKIDAVTVEGKIQKPEAFYILQRRELNFKGLEPKKSFIPLIIKSVEKEPF